MREDQIIQNAVKVLLLGAAPERRSELKEAFIELAPLFQLSPDTMGNERIIFDAGAYRCVRFNHRVLRSFWIGGYAAWEGYRLVAESDDEEHLNTDRFQELLSSFEQTLLSDQLELEPLPQGVPEPGEFPDSELVQSRAAAELAVISVAWALLHELRHIRHQQEGTAAGHTVDEKHNRHLEEFSCDMFATRFLLEKVEIYAQESGVDPAQVRRKRHLGIYFGLFSVSLLASGHWEESDTHPSLQDRLEAVSNLIGKELDDTTRAMVHAAFGVLNHQLPGSPNPFPA